METRKRRLAPFLWTLLALVPLPATAQFASSEVSGSAGSPPFFLTKGNGGTFEDLSPSFPGVTYNVYRRLPADGFRCLTSALTTASWSGDPQTPMNAVWWYAVNADDGLTENRLGTQAAIAQPCRTSPGGACCIGSTCSESTRQECMNAGGDYQGDLAECTPATCLATGSCCLGIGPCQERTQSSCLSAGGTYLGNGSICFFEDYCAACCHGATCTNTTLPACAGSGGSYQGEGTWCGASSCVRGACCTASGCRIETRELCQSLFGGIYLGDGTTCGPASC